MGEYETDLHWIHQILLGMEYASVSAALSRRPSWSPWVWSAPGDWVETPGGCLWLLGFAVLLMKLYHRGY